MRVKRMIAKLKERESRIWDTMKVIPVGRPKERWFGLGYKQRFEIQENSGRAIRRFTALAKHMDVFGVIAVDMLSILQSRHAIKEMASQVDARGRLSRDTVDGIMRFDNQIYEIKQGWIERNISVRGL